jgi:hypothetical protein
MASTEAKLSQKAIYRLKISIDWTSCKRVPPIWRRIEVPGHFTLTRLHHLLFTAMGWRTSYFHRFTVGEVVYGDIGEVITKDERGLRLKEIALEEGFEFAYETGYSTWELPNDWWWHNIVVEKIFEPEPSVKYPRCIGGARASPPDDCPDWAYEDLIEALANPKSEDYEKARERLPDDFDPEQFNIEEVNNELRRFH